MEKIEQIIIYVVGFALLIAFALVLFPIDSLGLRILPAPVPVSSPAPEATATDVAPAATATDAITSTKATATVEPTEVATVSPAESATTAEDFTLYHATVVNRYPHDPEAFTQGLVWEEGQFLEGTGLRGRSTVRRVDAESGEVLQTVSLADTYFGEGITTFGDRLYQLTWQAQKGFVYDRQSFEVLQEFSYPTEGWGITHDGERLIMSDGTATLYFWDPQTLEEIGSITVTYQGEPVPRLNELEYIDGSIYANVWQTNQIVIIDPATGVVTGVIDLTDLLTADLRSGTEDVLNGIAFDAANDRLFVTGKLWPWIFEIKLVPVEG